MIFEKMPKLPDELAAMDETELNKLCEDIRGRLVEVVSKNGGHLASNLGVVELTVALYSVYNPHYDRIVWDVGHQSYVHKILTGRDENFDTLRRAGGVSGFPKRNESDADAFNTGHSSTSISAAIGMARAYKIMGDKRNIIAVIGDGALTGGMSYEALEDVAQSKCNIKIILNDNAMSIGKNVGGMSKYLAKLRHKHSYLRTKNKIRHFLSKVPLVGQPISRLMSKIKNSFKKVVVGHKFFEDLGCHYLGPVDGHDIIAMKMVFERANEIDGPVFIHVQTDKGKGYEPAEKNPSDYHGVGPFDPATGEIIRKNKTKLSDVFAEKLCEMAEKDEKIAAVTAAMSLGTGLDKFSAKYPARFVDVGIAEEHAVTMAAGMAAAGMKPVVTIYSTFMQRAFDQLMHDVAIQRIPFVVTLDRAGICGYDGETHHGIYDIAYMRTIPCAKLMAPSTAKQLVECVEKAIGAYDNAEGSVVGIRYPACDRFEFYDDSAYIDAPFGDCSGRVVFDNSLNDRADVLIVSCGEMLNEAFKAAKSLASAGKTVIIYDAVYVVGCDFEPIRALAATSAAVITIEDGIREGGFGENVSREISHDNITVLAFPRDEIIENDSIYNQFRRFGVCAEAIIEHAT